MTIFVYKELFGDEHRSSIESAAFIRPHFTLQILCALCLFIGAHGGLVEAVRLSLTIIYVILFVLLASLAVLLIRLRYERKRLSKLLVVLIGVVALLAGFVLGSRSLASSRQARTQLETNNKGTVTCKIGASKKTQFGIKTDAAIYGLGVPAHVELLGLDELEPGSVIVVSGHVSSGRRPPTALMEAQGFVGTLKVSRVLSVAPPAFYERFFYRISQYIEGVIQPYQQRTRALMSAVLLANRQPARQFDIPELFKQAGLAHVVAVSGAHLVVITRFCERLLKCFQLRPRMRFLLLALLSGCFVLICQSPISALRAWCMSLSVYSATLFGRRSHGLTALAYVIIVFLVLDIRLAANLGFALSVCALVGLQGLAPFIKTYLDRIPALPYKRVFKPRLAHLARQLDLKVRVVTSSSIGVMLSCMWISLIYFKELNLSTVLSNLVVMPLFVPYIELAAAACFLCWTGPIAQMLLWLCDQFAVLLLNLIALLARCSILLSGEQAILVVVIGLVLGGVGMAFKAGYRLRIIGFVLVLSLLGTLVGGIWHSIAAKPRMCVLDVGQGDAILFQDRDINILVDTGPPGTIVDALRRNHVKKIDAIFITHWHDDHYAGLSDLVGVYEVGVLYIAKGATQGMPSEVQQAIHKGKWKPPVEIHAGQCIRLGNFSFELLWPQAAVAGDTNPDSLIMRGKYQEGSRRMSVLLTGDAERDEIKAALDACKPFTVDVLKVGHHGSAVSIYAEDLVRLKPSIAAISCGKANRYGHPAPTLMEILEPVCNVFVTKDCGDISIVADEAQIEVRHGSWL